MAILTDQAELTTPALNDWVHVVDVSDTSDNAAGSSKKVRLSNLLASAPLISSGSGAPATTPGKIGDIYIDTSTPAFYYAKGTTNSSDWTQVVGSGGSGGGTESYTLKSSGSATLSVANDLSDADDHQTILVNPTAAGQTIEVPAFSASDSGKWFQVSNIGDYKMTLDIVTNSISVTGNQSIILPAKSAAVLIGIEEDEYIFIGTADEQDVLIIAMTPNSENATTGDGKGYIAVPAKFNGWEVVDVFLYTSASNPPTGSQASAQLNNNGNDVLSTPVTIDAGETGSNSAGTAPVVNSTNATLTTHQRLRADLDQVGSTNPGRGYQMHVIIKPK